MDLSFQEKSILGSLVITVIVFAYYFLEVFKVFTADTSYAAASLPPLLIGVVIAIVIIEAVYHSLIALRSRPEREDERDRLIEAKATRIAYYVLVTGCVLTIGHATISAYLYQDVPGRALAGPIITANFVLFFFIVAEIVGFAMQLYYYRRGV